MLQGQWRNLSSSAQLRPNFWKILRRFPIQLSTTKLAGCLLLTPIHPTSAHTHTQSKQTPFEDRRTSGINPRAF